MHDWEQEHLIALFGGGSCLMAMTRDGRILRKTQTKSPFPYLDNWLQHDIFKITVGSLFSDFAIGLTRNGACIPMTEKWMAHWWKSCASDYREYSHRYEKPTNMPDSYENAVRKIRNLKNIRQVLISDAVFALDWFGFVHYIPFPRSSELYHEVHNWRNVIRLIATPEANIFGITADGRVLAAGHSTGDHGPKGNVRDKIDALTDVAGFVPEGPECTDMYYIKYDGTLHSLFPNFFWTQNLRIAQSCCSPPEFLCSFSNRVLYLKDMDGTVYRVPPIRNEATEIAQDVVSFACSNSYIDYYAALVARPPDRYRR